MARRSARVCARQNVAYLSSLRTLRVDSELAELERDETWLREQLEHDRDTDLFAVLCARVTAALYEFTADEARMIALYVPIHALDPNVEPWPNTLATRWRGWPISLASPASTPFRTRAVPRSCRPQSRRDGSLAAGFRQIELIILGTRIGGDPRDMRRRMWP